MITIRFNPKALTREGQVVKRVKYIPQHSVIFYVQMNDFKYTDVYFILSGRKADPDDIVKDGDEIIIVPEVQAFLAPVIAWFAALAFWQQVAVVIATLATIYSLVSAMLQNARKPSYGDGGDSSSPTYGFDGIQNTADQGLPVPVVYGTMRVGGQVIGEYVAVGSAVTLGGGSNPEVDNNYLNLLLALSEGVVDNIGSIEINGNPIANYQNVAVTTVPGTNTQAPIPAFQQVHDLRSVNEQLSQSTPEVYTTFNAVDALELHFLMPDGLYSEDQNSGQIQSLTVEFLVEYKLHSSGTYLTYETVSVSAQTQAAQRFIVRLDNTNVLTVNGIYDIRVTQLSKNSDFFDTTFLTWDTVDEINFEDLAYPNTALLALNALATSQLSGSTPTVTSLIRGIMHSVPKVVDSHGSTVVWDNYYFDPTASSYKLISNGSTLFWDGATFYTAYSANPIWCLRDLLTNTRYGLGQFIGTAQIDLPSFIANSQYCENLVSDGVGGFEKRLQLNIVLDSSQKVLDWISSICATFRGLVFYSAGTIKVKIDQPGTPVQLFTMGNIKNMGFSQAWLPLKQRFNCIQVQFLNQALDYQNDQVAVVDDAALSAGQPLRMKSIRMYCTTASQAFREGQILLWMNKYITRLVTLKADIDAITCEAGDIISVAHDVPAWGIGSGHVQSGSTTSVVNLDIPITMVSGTTYAILVRHAADDTIEEKQITTGPGTVSQVTLSSALTKIAAGDLYSIGSIGIETKPFRVVNIKYNGDFTSDIQAIEYNASIYNNSAIPTFTNYSELSNTLPNVTDLVLNGDYIVNSDGTIKTTIDVYFNRPSPIGIYVLYQSANIYYSDNAGANWVFAGNTRGGVFTIEDGLIKGTQYKIAVCSVDANGQQTPIAASPQASVIANGKVTPPSNVTTFLVNQNKTAYAFGWTPVPDKDLSGYEIRAGASWVGGTVIATQIKNTAGLTLNLIIGTNVFWIAAIDTSGNYSAQATQATVIVAEIPYQNIINSYSEEPSWAGTLHQLTLVGAVLQCAGTNLVGTYSTPVRDIGFVATFTIQAQAVVVDANTSALMNSDSTLLMNTSLTTRMSGAYDPNAGSLYINTSQDNITWSGWQPYQVGDYTCRYFQLALMVQRSTDSTVIQIDDLDYYADLPSVVDTGPGTVTVAASGVAINFVKTFHQIPSISITILSGSGIYALVTGTSTTGFTVTLYNAAGVTETGTFSWTANGV